MDMYQLIEHDDDSDINKSPGLFTPSEEPSTSGLHRLLEYHLQIQGTIKQPYLSGTLMEKVTWK